MPCDEDFDIPKSASTPNPATNIAANPTPAPSLAAPLPPIAAPVADTPETTEAPKTFKDALAAVQRLQVRFENLPNTTRAEQQARHAAGQALEAAKKVAFEMQQLPEVPVSFAAASMVADSLPQRIRREPVDSIRQQVIARMQNR